MKTKALVLVVSNGKMFMGRSEGISLVDAVIVSSVMTQQGEMLITTYIGNCQPGANDLHCVVSRESSYHEAYTSCVSGIQLVK